ncbi:MAG: pyruvate, water dikinase [Deltaproteobacteria bacterium]|nr:pyruvate, water dikinase [Deltaproteobacteria bacterium]
MRLHQFLETLLRRGRQKETEHFLTRLFHKLQDLWLKSFSRQVHQRETEYSFGKLFKKFQDILTANNEALELIADMGDKLSGEYIFDRQYILSVYEQLKAQVHNLIFDLNSLAPRKYDKLFNRFEDINEKIQQDLTGKWILPRGDAVIPYAALSQDMNELVGNKNANLADVKNVLELATPDGFAVTTSAFRSFLEWNQLYDQLQHLFASWDPEDETSTEQVAEAVEACLLNGKFPPELIQQIDKAVEVLQKKYQGEPLSLAVRSSAWGEDGVHSFAGQYKTYLNVPVTQLPESYKKVLAGAYSRTALAYQSQKGFQIHELAMAVACQTMVRAKVSGVVYTMDLSSPEEDNLMISATWGLGVPVVKGEAHVDQYIVCRTPPHALCELTVVHKPIMMIAAPEGGTKYVPVSEDMANRPCLITEQLEKLAEMALSIERYFKRPQDIEWALNQNGNFVILQTRPLNIMRQPGCSMDDIPHATDNYPLLMHDQGVVVQRGVAAGQVFVLSDNADLSRVPHGSILVTRHTSPRLAGVMRKVHGILTDVGSPMGHMATIAREFRVPTIVNTKVATQVFKTGDEITLDATQNRIYAGRVRELCYHEFTSEDVFEESYEYRLLRRILRKISPLNLVDPHDNNFNPVGCLTLHDIIRFIHEKAVEELVQSGDKIGTSDVSTKRLKFDIPLGLFVIDIGEGIRPKTSCHDIRPEDITSVPMQAFLDGLMQPGMWSNDPVSVDFGSFMSSLTRTFSTTTGSPRYLGRNLAVVSKEYLDLSLKLGYHFNIIDAYISDKLNDNYAYFRFLGGVTDVSRRSRRAKFIGEVLEQFNFRVEIRGDLVVGRIKKLDRPLMVEKMRLLGCLVGYTRQLDIQMHSDEYIGQHLDDFLQRAADIKHRSEHEES